MNPRHPIYIVSKGRSDLQITSRVLDGLGVPHFVVVEGAELEAYAAKAPPSASFLVLDPEYQRTYKTCDELGDAKGKGPGPARNFAWDHAVSAGADWHWVMDDNIREFIRLNHNQYFRSLDGTPLACMEDFADRFSNVAMAGPNYFMFVPRRERRKAFFVNTRIYSCNLIRNDVPFRWRGRYNEDTDLSLRMLKASWCTLQFNAFLAHKLTTQTLKGGNTTEFYAREGTLPKSQMLVRLHPDVARLAVRWNRAHHYVDYSGFKHRPVLRPGVEVAAGVDDYGMNYLPLPSSRKASRG